MMVDRTTRRGFAPQRVAAVVLFALVGAVPALVPSSASAYSVLCNQSGIGCISQYGYTGQSVWGYPVDVKGNNCTNYAAFRLSRNGASNPGNFGNAGDWAGNASAKGFPVNGTPAVGAIAQWNYGSAYAPSYGHVAYVEEVTGSDILLSDSSWNGGSKQWRVKPGEVQWPSNFLHIRDVAGGGWGGVGNASFAGSAVLYAGASLPRNSYLLSPDGGHVFIHQSDGNVVLYSGGRAVWNSQTGGRATTTLSMQTDGHLVLYNGSTPVWMSNTAGSGASRLVVQDDGNVVLYRSNNSWVWQTGTGGKAAPYYAFGDRLTSGVSLGQNQYLRSADRRYVLIHQTDGNVVLYAPGWRPIWNTQTGGRATTSLTMQSDGHLVLYNGSSPVWTSNTAGSGATRMVVQSDGNLVLYRADNSWVWQTQTSGRL